ncbi:2-C-methyl-D-erythritol 2,4-cyclodiphosphate synthase [uncultured Ilyobacter sp.]|uniref:2-C-methyl-D-erythritol 2,4-cyclodiphosphate synthase n=1 Tax=uncultured Ilyobacter sp. TaxID=544433 RepID=UPI0029F521CE|nr:2-C-methyl-D-erythritol 2,4-cyclodiphosphate synthase [uncultured Ilyobacter sp.]
MLRIGNGYDVHRFKEGRKLILGGVEIPHEKGLDGHSDADVLVHAIMDAMLGALALGDIGQHFPDDDEGYRGVSSMVLLGHVNKLVKEKGYNIVNLDSIIVAQRPKLKSYIENMRGNIAEELDIDRECISVKATTEEELGFTGEELGIKSYCVILLGKVV